MSVSIATSPGRSGFGPQLALSYDSGSSNGPFGFGWALVLPQITRKTDKGCLSTTTPRSLTSLSPALKTGPVLVKEEVGPRNGCPIARSVRIPKASTDTGPKSRWPNPEGLTTRGFDAQHART